MEALISIKNTPFRSWTYGSCGFKIVGMKNGIEAKFLEARKKLARRIRELRKKQEWTQQELAEQADLATRHIQRLESKRPPSIELDSIVKISAAFKITPSELLDF